MIDDDGFERKRVCIRCHIGWNTYNDSDCRICRIYGSGFDAYSWLNGRTVPEGDNCLVFFRQNISSDFIWRWRGTVKTFFVGAGTITNQIAGWNAYEVIGNNKKPLPIRIVSSIKYVSKTPPFIAEHYSLDTHSK